MPSVAFRKKWRFFHDGFKKRRNRHVILNQCAVKIHAVNHISPLLLILSWHAWTWFSLFFMCFFFGPRRYVNKNISQSISRKRQFVYLDWWMRYKRTYGKGVWYRKRTYVFSFSPEVMTLSPEPSLFLSEKKSSCIRASCRCTDSWYGQLTCDRADRRLTENSSRGGCWPETGECDWNIRHILFF